MYIYNDEDNFPMSDSFNGFHNPTVYTSRSEMNYYESAQYERDMEAAEEARDIRDSQIREFFMDALEIPRDSECRECPWMHEEIIEQYEADDDLALPGDAYEVAQKMCEVCKAHSKEERDNVLNNFFKEIDEQ